MVTIKELTERFPVDNVAPYGKSIIIPAVEFGRSWEDDLKQQGCKTFSGSLEGRAVFYVKLPNESRKTRETPLGYTWSGKEDQRLIALVKEQLSTGREVDFEEIAKQLPGRSVSGVRGRIIRLQKKGLLPKFPRRKYRRREKPAPAPVTTKITKTETHDQLLNVIDRTFCLTPTIEHTLHYLQNRQSNPAFKTAAIDVVLAALDVIKKEFELMKDILAKTQKEE